MQGEGGRGSNDITKQQRLKRCNVEVFIGNVQFVQPGRASLHICMQESKGIMYKVALEHG
jgi:hypothetical protein